MVGFLFILAVFLLGYGVAAVALTSPHKNFTASTLIEIIYQPYFTIYGELFLLDQTEENAGKHM